MGTLEFAVIGLAGSGIGAALGLPLLWPRSTQAPGTAVLARLMGGWLLAVSLVVAIISARVIGLLPGSAAAEHAVNILGLSSFPLLYMYVYRQTRPSAPQRRMWWLWLPAAAYATLIVIRASLGTDTRVPFAWMLPVLLAFTLGCAWLVARREDQAPAGIIPAEWLVGFLVVLNAAQIVRMLFGHVAPVPALVPFVITLEFVALVGVVAWRAAGSRPPTPDVVLPPRYEKSGLDADAGRALLDRVERALSNGRLFADPGLTLSGLAASVDSTPHQVSEVLNRYGNVTFHELLNRQRVDDVKMQLRDPSADAYTIEGIGASAGFGSRSALYAAFRRLEGMTPAEFRAQRK